MCMVAPSIPMINNHPHKPTYNLYFGWGRKDLNFLYFGQYGPYPVFTELKYEILSFISSKEGLFHIYL